MPKLRFLDLDLQTVTPLLTGGAFYQAELRAPSFRGVLRYWLRVLLGGVLGPKPILVRHVESILFGSTSRSSLIAVRATGEPAKADIPVARDDFPGIGYLFYSAYQGRRDVILPEESFHLRLQTRPLPLPELEIEGQPFDATTAWHLAAASLWLASHLGNVGHRMRRGAGGIRFLAKPHNWPEHLPSPLVEATTPQQLAELYGTHLSSLRRALGWTPVSGVPTIPSFNLLHPDVCQLYILDRTYPTWHEALDEVGQAFKAFRSREPHDYENVKGFLLQTRSQISSLKRVVFGLPLMFFFSSLYRELLDKGVSRREASSRASAMVVPQRGGARPSPLWFKVVPLAGEKPTYTVQMLFFHSQFLPDNTLTLRARDRSIRPVNFTGPTEFSYIEEWLDQVSEVVGPLLPVDFG